MSDDKQRIIDDLAKAGRITPERAEEAERLNAAMRYALKDFVGKELTPLLIAEAEGQVRKALDEMIKAGKYTLPPGVVLDRVELGDDMRIKVYYKRTDSRIVKSAAE